MYAGRYWVLDVSMPETWCQLSHTSGYGFPQYAAARAGKSSRAMFGLTRFRVGTSILLSQN